MWLSIPKSAHINKKTHLSSLIKQNIFNLRSQINKYYYKHLSQRERRKLETLICNKPILKPIFGTTDHGWDIVKWKWLVNVNSIAFALKRSRKTIKRELLNGRYETLTNNISKIALTFSYSADISRFNRIKKYESKNKQKTKILKFE